MREELEQIKKLSELQLVEYFQDGVIARDHSFHIENNAFKVQSETDLKKVLYAMDQRYYYAAFY